MFSYAIQQVSAFPFFQMKFYCLYQENLQHVQTHSDMEHACTCTCITIHCRCKSNLQGFVLKGREGEEQVSYTDSPQTPKNPVKENTLYPCTPLYHLTKDLNRFCTYCCSLWWDSSVQ